MIILETQRAKDPRWEREGGQHASVLNPLKNRMG